MRLRRKRRASNSCEPSFGSLSFEFAELGNTNYMQALTLRKTVGPQGPFASVYFDDSHNTEDSAKLAELRRRSILESLEAQGASEKLLALLAAELASERPPRGRRGRAVVANADEIVLDEIILEPPASEIVRLDPLPYLVPLVKLGDDGPPCVVVFVNKIGADFVVIDAYGRELQRQSLDGRDDDVHKPRTQGYWGLQDTEAHPDEVVRSNLAAVARALPRVVEEVGADLVVLVGELQSRSVLSGMLPEALQPRTMILEGGGRTSGADYEETLARACELLADRRHVLVDEVLERFAAEDGRKSGLAVRGVDAVNAALEQANVEVLFVEPETVEARVGDVPADELLPYRAVETGADIVCPEDVHLSDDGFAALLRHQ